MDANAPNIIADRETRKRHQSYSCLKLAKQSNNKHITGLSFDPAKSKQWDQPYFDFVKYQFVDSIDVPCSVFYKFVDN